MGTRRDEQAADYRFEEKLLGERSRARSDIRSGCRWFSESARPAPAPANDMRTKLCVLQVQFDTAIRERDDAARNRDRLHGELGDCRQKLTAAETEATELGQAMQKVSADAYDVSAARIDRDDAIKRAEAAEARVVDLESQLESVACRAATAETALEAAQAASGWRDLDSEVGDVVEEGDEVFVFNIWKPVNQVEIDMKVFQHGFSFRRRVPAQAASGGGEGEPVAHQELQDRGPRDTEFVIEESAGNGSTERLHRETWLRRERDELINTREELIRRVAELEAASGGGEVFFQVLRRERRPPGMELNGGKVAQPPRPLVAAGGGTA